MLKKKSILRLTRLANFLNTLPEDKFDFSDIVKETNGHACGTIGCAVGWLPAISPNFKWEIGSFIPLKQKFSYKGKSFWHGMSWTSIAEYFAISYDDAMELFIPIDARGAIWNKKHDISAKSSAKQVSAAIKRYIKYRSTHAE